MSISPFKASVFSMLTITLLSPSLFFASPLKARAQLPLGVPTGVVYDLSIPSITTAAKTTVSAIEETLIQINTFTSAAANYANYVNTYVLQPLAFVLSGQLMKALTAGVMQFVIGKANGTGIPQFVVDVRQSLQSISDFQKNAYLRQVSLTNSPFATSIAQALSIDYSQKTSLAGYWASNMNTLGQNIPTYQPGFLAGNWSQGGVAAWFQLTTQSQNNPYLLYQNSQRQLGNVIGSGVGGGTGARLAELQWGKGFMSWCSPNEEAKQKTESAKIAQDFCIAEGGSFQKCEKLYASYIGDLGGTFGGVDPGDPCTDRETGNPGKIETPGSVISGVLDKVLGGQQDKLVQMGNISSQVNSILGNIGTVLNTINLAANILGGSSGNGLLNAGSPGGALTNFGAPALATTGNFTSENGYGVSGSQITSEADSSDVTTARNVDPEAAVAKIPDTIIQNFGNDSTSSDMPARVQKYKTAWSSIALSANMASSTLQSVMATCNSYHRGNSSYENAAWNALSSAVNPVLTQAAGIKAIADAALAQETLVKSQATTTSTYAADLQKLNTMPPTASDVSTAQYNATAYGGAKADPAGSLTVSGGSIVDQMNLIRNNATAMQAAYCTAQDSGSGGD